MTKSLLIYIYIYIIKHNRQNFAVAKYLVSLYSSLHYTSLYSSLLYTHLYTHLYSILIFTLYTDSVFDVTMGSFDGAEVCELVGLFILNSLQERFGENVGLYHDDGLAVVNTRSGRLCDKERKELIRILPCKRTNNAPTSST